MRLSCSDSLRPHKSIGGLRKSIREAPIRGTGAGAVVANAVVAQSHGRKAPPSPAPLLPVAGSNGRLEREASHGEAIQEVLQPRVPGGRVLL